MDHIIPALALVLAVTPALAFDALPPGVTPSQLAAAQAAAIAQAPGTYTDTKAAAAAPVQTVNTKTGTVVVPVVCRQQSNATTIPTTNPSSLTWSFPLANNPQACSFATPPSCWSDISTTATGSVFDYPQKAAGTTTSTVTYTYTAHSASVNVVVAGVTIISVGGTSGAPPSGSSVVLTCTAPPA